jgi:hypothetical protein
MSRKYLGSYCAERDFVYNARKLSDDERTEKAIKSVRGKRLMLKQPKNVEGVEDTKTATAKKAPKDEQDLPF